MGLLLGLEDLLNGETFKKSTLVYRSMKKWVERLVRDKEIISVCAYPADRTSDSLKRMLMNCHGAMITGDEVVYLN
jgi:hypothetical protein